MSELYVNYALQSNPNIKVAILDFDGTISTLRCGWEGIMEPLMLKAISPNETPSKKVVDMVKEYIDQSTGIQTIYQMEWLSKVVSEMTNTPPVDPWIYKDKYNDKLLEMVTNRINLLERGELNPSDFLVNGSYEFLEKLKSEEITIYIASGTDDVDLQKEVRLLGIDKFVKRAMGAPRRKKDCSKEAVIKDILNNSEVLGEHLLVVGDGKVEIQLGNEVGAVTIGVASDEINKNGKFNTAKYEKLKKAGANYIVADFDCII